MNKYNSTFEDWFKKICEYAEMKNLVASDWREDYDAGLDAGTSFRQALGREDFGETYDYPI
jgi:hypothetical protein